MFRALQLLNDARDEVDGCCTETAAAGKLAKVVREFHGYIAANKAFIRSYGDRYRRAERVATGFVESTVNQVVSKPMVKQQQMRFSEARRTPAVASPHTGVE